MQKTTTFTSSVLDIGYCQIYYFLMNSSLWKKIIKFLVFPVLIIISLSYLFFLYGLPKIVNSKTFEKSLHKIVYNKTNIDFSADSIKLTTHPNLSANIYIKKITAQNSNKEKIFTSDNLYADFDLIKPKLNTLCVNYIYFNKPEFDKLNLFKINPDKKEIKIKKIPNITVKNGDIIIADKTSVELMKFNIVPSGKYFVSTIDANINSSLYEKPLNIKGKGQLEFNNNTLTATNYELRYGIAKFLLSGKLWDKNNKYDINIATENLHVNLLEKSFLVFMKQKNSQKNFIENFYDFGGFADIKLNVKPKNLTGTCKISNLAAKTVKFSVPINLPEIVFRFDKDKIKAGATGTFGGEKTYTDFEAVNIFDKTRVVSGNVKSTLDSDFAKTYIPDADITNKVDLHVKYVVKNRKPEVEYLAKIPVGSNIHYKSGDLGLENTVRRVYAKTIKNGDNLFLDSYDYSFVSDNNNISKIIHGEGLFVKKDGKFNLDYITCQTDGYAPVSVTGSFGRYVSGGTFIGNLKYNHKKGIITGKFNLKDSRYKEFHVNDATVNADDNTMEISSNGTFQGSPFTGYINMVNRFEDVITIHKIDLYLQKFIAHKNKMPKQKIRLKVPPKTKDIKWIVEEGKIRLDKLGFRKVVVENLELTGNIRDNKVNFSMPDVDFAKGKLAAHGIYNISNHSSEADFTAKNIDSNIAADMILNLHEQIEGFADATLHVTTQNKLEHINAHATFNIKEGALTKLGSREFIIKKSKRIHRTIKFKLPDIINIDARKIQALKSNIKGSFDICEDDIKNVEVYSGHKYLSTFTEGKYNILTQDAQIQIWGKYNKNAQRGIRILFVPLSMITKIIFRPEKTRYLYTDKINKIPHIEATPNELEIFNVWVEGNINDTSKIKLQMKRLR